MWNQKMRNMERSTTKSTCSVRNELCVYLSRNVFCNQ